ncbi:MAG: RNA polymerase subunit sigma-70 [Deltaproteobacteria bacterium]|nr:RNA polymerase factor sigma-32 [Deltaproteobacteria bacterium]MBW2214355.1 RNA polymerase factor sigma-32 [Deltaproteobacteria bacterium]MBW2379281.1 RNA polymerase factor sigma-32 [Deltaproteobacteria bacterium]MBW2550013.1 RNA polymerase factor sigma-32 [Deltaproteobacteria bacterium]MBW2627068.1 RNA polymerase factor sigma-32 [Deltaproteobacteria bacterium]
MIGTDPEPPDEFDEPQGVEIVDIDAEEDGGESDALVSSSSSLTRRDPLGAYMRDVQRYTLLSKQEEHDLAVRFIEQDDLEAAKRLVTSNLRLVVKIAYDYRQAYKNILDLVQEGNIGLMQAVRKYDPYKGVKLSSYAAWWIRAYMLRYILNNHRLVKVGTTQAQRKLFFNLKKEKAKLSAMGIEPTAQIIAERLNVPERDVVSMDMRLAAGDASLDAPVGTAEGRSVARVELLPSEDVRVDDTLADAEIGDQFAQKIHEFGSSLENKEKKIFEDRLVADDPKTLQTLGDEFGVSRERVRQIEKRLLKKLKAYLQSELSETVVEVYESP